MGRQGGALKLVAQSTFPSAEGFFSLVGVSRGKCIPLGGQSIWLGLVHRAGQARVCSEHGEHSTTGSQGDVHWGVKER